MSNAINITIYDDSEQQQIVNELKFSSGIIVTDEMQAGAPKIVTTMQDIKSSNYGIVDVGLSQFDDSLALENKISECQNRINIYTQELADAEKFLQSYNTEYNRLSAEIESNKDELAYGNAAGTLAQSDQNSLRAQIQKLETQRGELKDKKTVYTNRKTTHPSLIEKYNSFLNDLKTYGEQKPVQTVESLGKQEDKEDIALDNIDINQAPGMALSRDVINAVSQYLEATVQSLIAGGAANIMNNIGINQENLQFAQQILNLMDSSIFKIESILKFIPTNIHMVPSPKVAMSSICTSLKDMYEAMYTAVEQKYYETINDAITNLPSMQEILKDSQEALLNIAYNMIDEQCVKYTGMHLVELYFLCRKYIALYKEWKQRRKEKKQMGEEGYIGEISIEYDDESVKKQLMEELANASDLIYNAFFIIQIRDAIDQIRDLIRQFNNIDLTVLADGIDSLDDLINLLDEIGLNDNSAVLTLDQAIKSGINSFQNNLNGLTAQLAAQGIASGINIIQAANISVNVDVRQAFSFSVDLNKLELTLTINEDPTVKKVRKNIMSALSNAKNNQDEKIFSANDVLIIMNAIDKGYNEKKDQKIDVSNSTFVIHFTIDGFNLPSTIPYDVYKEVEKTIQQIELKKQQEREDALSNFELGVVTEEYTADPNEAVRRPTIQLVHELFAILQEVFPLMKIFAELVSNYKINKAKVETHAQGNIFGMVKVLAKLNNLLKKCNKNDKNFYTIRSLQTYNYVTENIKHHDNDSPELNLSLEETRTLQLYLKARSLNYSSIDLKKETLVYIDYDSLDDQRKEMQDALDKANGYFGEDSSLFVDYPEPRYEDGTILGLDKVEEAGDEVYYSDSSLSIYGSQIMYCYSRNYDVSI